MPIRYSFISLALWAQQQRSHSGSSIGGSDSAADVASSSGE
jgi:hypothetical protein